MRGTQRRSIPRSHLRFLLFERTTDKGGEENETVFNGETFVLRRNEEDKYGDGNNFELALTAELGEMWKEEAEEKKAEEEAKEKKTYIFEYEPKLWVDLGSALEMEMEKKIENEENDDDHNDVYQDKDDDDKDNDSETFIAHDSGIQSTAELETKSTQVHVDQLSRPIFTIRAQNVRI